MSEVIKTHPLAVLAGLLVHVGVNLVNLAHFPNCGNITEAAIYFATILGVTCVNLLAGVGL